ncbi:MAG: arabinan endo-1,5-alpha-L-arabinosidase, partial [Oxalobacteraceae bacterium]
MSLRSLLVAATACVLIASGIAAAEAGPATTGPINSVITGDIVPTHDPVLVKEKGVYYVFGTGITLKTSPDLIHWTAQAPPLARVPEWGLQAVPGTKDMWAPDVSFFNGRWHLYYALSTFGSNQSAVGLFTSATLDAKAPDYGWRDEGLVVMSHHNNNYNAIDPNHFIDSDGRHWLTLGSFWGGIKLFALNPKTGKLLVPGAKPIALARRLA